MSKKTQSWSTCVQNKISQANKLVAYGENIVWSTHEEGKQMNTAISITGSHSLNNRRNVYARRGLCEREWGDTQQSIGCCVCVRALIYTAGVGRTLELARTPIITPTNLYLLE